MRNLLKSAALVLALLAGPWAAQAESAAAAPNSTAPNSAAPATPSTAATESTGGEKAGESRRVEWQAWHAGNSLSDLASLQRGARNFMNYCNGCHALKYVRYQRMADDLEISTAVLDKDLVAPGSNNLDYITTAMPPADAVNWFGKVPPDLSLITRSKGADYVYRFLKTFYVDPSSPTGSNNLAYPSAAMPAVLSDLSGVNEAVYVQSGGEKVFDHFASTVPGSMSSAQFDQFVRDTVNFLDYAGEPTQLERQWIGIWVVLFLLLLTALSWLLKNEYWKDVH